jgi:hypothetical protein
MRLCPEFNGRTDDLAERGTPGFYREQAARLTLLAAHASSPERRLESLQMAAVFLKLANKAVANSNDLATETKARTVLSVARSSGRT